LTLYHEQFSATYDLPEVHQQEKTLIVASTGRSGSHMLGHALQTTNHFGFPLEYTNPSNYKEWAKRLGEFDLKEMIGEIKRKRTSPNGVFGIKIHYSHVNEMYGGFEGVQTIFPDAYYVLLTRKDVLKQAVSLAIARQTGVWISGQKSRCLDPQYRFKNIDACLREVILDSAAWRFTLAANGCKFIEMNFDQVKTDLSKAINIIADFMAVDISDMNFPRQQVLKRQSGELNIEWEKKYLAEFRESELINTLPAKDNFSQRYKNKLTKLLERIKTTK